MFHKRTTNPSKMEECEQCTAIRLADNEYTAHINAENEYMLHTVIEYMLRTDKTTAKISQKVVYHDFVSGDHFCHSGSKSFFQVLTTSSQWRSGLCSLGHTSLRPPVGTCKVLPGYQGLLHPCPLHRPAIFSCLSLTFHFDPSLSAKRIRFLKLQWL